jgi:molybdopterin converting factor small subunit
VAVVRFTSHFSRISGQERVRMQAGTLGELCRELITRYGPGMNVLLDSEGNISRGIVVLVNRMNAYALSGAATALEEDSEVLIMPILSGG